MLFLVVGVWIWKFGLELGGLLLLLVVGFEGWLDRFQGGEWGSLHCRLE